MNAWANRPPAAAADAAGVPARRLALLPKDGAALHEDEQHGGRQVGRPEGDLEGSAKQASEGEGVREGGRERGREGGREGGREWGGVGGLKQQSKAGCHLTH